MEKERVKEGEIFWYINFSELPSNESCVYSDPDWRNNFADDSFESKNYFHTKEEAEAMVEKIRSLLND